MIAIDLSQVPEGFEGRAVQLDDAPDWLTFVSPEGEDCWTCLASSDRIPETVDFDFSQPDFMEKVCALLGYRWDEVSEAPLTAMWQAYCLRSLGGKLMRRLRFSTVEEVAEWRACAETLTEGELLAGSLFGTDPLALRN